MNNVKLIAGNWKMNGSLSSTKELLSELTKNVSSMDNSSFKMVVCPPSILIPEAINLTADSAISVGGQDCHEKNSGAYTGNTSPLMLKESGCEYVILGHSERRQYHAESDELIASKAKAAHDAGLIAIICVGELEAQREAGKQNEVVCNQLSKAIPDSANANNTVIAYEPVWAIGTGKTASADDVKNMHEVIRNKIKEQMQDADNVSLLYGGSVKADNAKEILHTPNVDGVLVGGASLKSADFTAIAKASSSSCGCCCNKSAA